MSDLSRHRPYLVWGAVSVGLSILVVLLLMPGGSWIALDERRSSLRTTPDGVAAWARSLEALGVPVDRRFLPFDLTPPSGRGMVVLQPIVDFSADEAVAVARWVRGGGVLVYAPGFLDTLADSLGIDLDSQPADPYSSVTYRDSLPEGRWTEQAEAWASSRDRRVEVELERRDDWEPLSEGELAGASLGWLSMGDGGVLVVADSRELTNELLAESSIAVTATRAVVDLMARDTLVFSEYHQGMGGGRGLVREAVELAAALPVGRILLHLALTGAVVLALGGRRFGAPLPEPPTARRSTVEHVGAVAHIFKSGRSDRTVAHYLVRSAARRASLPVRAASEEDLLRLWSGRGGLSRPMREALTALQSEPPDLLALEAALDEAVLLAEHPGATTTSGT